jgi:hypothetical protein
MTRQRIRNHRYRYLARTALASDAVASFWRTVRSNKTLAVAGVPSAQVRRMVEEAAPILHRVTRRREDIRSAHMAG